MTAPKEKAACKNGPRARTRVPFLAGPACDIESKKINHPGQVTGSPVTPVLQLLHTFFFFFSLILFESGFYYYSFFLTSVQLGELGFTQKTVLTARSSKAAPARRIFGQSGKVLLPTKIENRTFSTS